MKDQRNKNIFYAEEHVILVTKMQYEYNTYLPKSK